MKTKSFLLTMLLLLTGSQVMFAQNNKRAHNRNVNPEKFQEAQCNMIVQELALDDATTERFCKVYKAYLDELKATYNSKIQSIKCPYCGREDCDGTDCPGPKDGNESNFRNTGKKLPTDAEVEARIKARFAQGKKILEIREKYYYEFREFLSPKQIQKMYVVEKRCKNKMRKHSDFRRYHHHQNNRH